MSSQLSLSKLIYCGSPIFFNYRFQNRLRKQGVVATIYLVFRMTCKSSRCMSLPQIERANCSYVLKRMLFQDLPILFSYFVSYDNHSTKPVIISTAWHQSDGTSCNIHNDYPVSAMLQKGSAHKISSLLVEDTAQEDNICFLGISLHLFHTTNYNTHHDGIANILMCIVAPVNEASCCDLWVWSTRRRSFAVERRIKVLHQCILATSHGQIKGEGKLSL